MDPKKTIITKPSPYPKGQAPKCVRKQNLLVYEKNNPCFNKPPAPNSSCIVTPLKATDVKKIKVCTGADLKRMVPPKICDFAPKPRKSYLGRLLGFGIKSAIAGGLVIWTYQQGLWGRADDTKEIYLEMCKYFRTPTKKEMEKFLAKKRQDEKCECGCDPFKDRQKFLQCEEKGQDSPITEQDEFMKKYNICQNVPSIRENTNCFKNCWNAFIVKAFDFIVNLPENIGHLLGTKEVKEKPCVPENKDKKPKVAKETEC